MGGRNSSAQAQGVGCHVVGCVTGFVLRINAVVGICKSILFAPNPEFRPESS